jgi:multicomponent Na+:H+ antiporter subunit F
MAVVLQYLVYFLIGSSVVSMIRIVIGPSVVDRMIGLSMVSAQILALLVVISVQAGRTIYLDVALVYDIFGFVGLLAITRYFTRERRTE